LIRHAIRVLAAGLVLTGLAAPSVAVERKLDVAAGTLVVDVDANWQPANDMSSEVSDVAVGFKLGDGSTMRWLFAPANDAPAGSGKPAQMRELTLALKEELAKQNAEFRGDGLLEIRTDHAIGYYVDAVDPRPKPGEYEFMMTGWVAVDSFPVMFNIVWNRGGERAAQRALDAVRGMRLRQR
jgi:hypothetical protein